MRCSLRWPRDQRRSPVTMALSLGMTPHEEQETAEVELPCGDDY